MGIRLVVVDDSPHVRWAGRVHAVNATFHRFSAAVLDLPGRPVERLVHCVPLSEAERDPGTLPLDPRIEVVATAPFDGIAGYLRHAPSLVRRNAPLLRRALAGADLCLVKVPASNALLAGSLAAGLGVPRAAWVAGSARDVARGRWPGARGAAAATVGRAYDLAGRLAAAPGERIVVGRDLVRPDGALGDGLVASLVEPGEIRTPAERWPAHPDRLLLAWAGRLAPGKGVEAVLDALALLGADGGRTFELLVLGDGPARPALAARADGLGLRDRVDWRGHVADRAAYMELLAGCDVFVLASPAEGFPKVVLDATAAGLPVLATPSGGLGALVEAGIVGRVAGGSPESVAEAVRGLLADPGRARELRVAGSRFAGLHTRPVEAERLVARLRGRWPRLAWAG